MKALCIDQNGQKVVVGVVGDDVPAPSNAELIELVSADYPEANVATRQFIDQNPMRSFNLYKVIAGTIALRSPEELDASTYINYEWEA